MRTRRRIVPTGRILRTPRTPRTAGFRKDETRELKCNHSRTNVSTNGALSGPGGEFGHSHAVRITSAQIILLFKDLHTRTRALPVTACSQKTTPADARTGVDRLGHGP